MVSLGILLRNTWKLQSYPDRIICWAIIGPPAKSQSFRCRLGVLGITGSDPLEKQLESPQEIKTKW